MWVASAAMMLCSWLSYVDRQVLAVLSRGQSNREIARSLSLSEETAKSHVSRILNQLGWTPQQPITRAIQRDDEAIERWREEVWPGLKKSRDATTAG